MFTPPINSVFSYPPAKSFLNKRILSLHEEDYKIMEELLIFCDSKIGESFKNGEMRRMKDGHLE